MNPAPAKKTGLREGLKFFPIILGLVVVAAFFSLTETDPGLFIFIGPPFTGSSPGELYFWLGYAMLGSLGTGLVGYGLSPWLGSVLAKSHRRILAMSNREMATGLVVAGLFAMLIAVVSRAYFLLGLPITDDEMAARFGGRILASGALEIDAPPLVWRLPNTYLYADGSGHITSLDWVGAQIVWALAEVTRLGSGVFAFLAAIPVIFVGLLVGRQKGRIFGVAAMLLLFMSPMAFALSMTTHAHVASRALLAVTLYVYCMARGTRRSWLWLIAGLCLGGGLLTRPFETASLLAPLAIWHIVQGFRGDKGLLQGALWMLLGVLPAISIFLVHSWQVTGDPLLPARWDAPANEVASKIVAGNAAQLWHHFGINTSYNLFMLAIWFLGPLGIVLVTAGVTSSRFCRLLGFGVACSLMVGLLHEDTGLHSVGPIHYSEAVIPLTILAACGLARIQGYFSRVGVSFRIAASIVVATTVLGLGMFNVWNGLALQRSARIQEHIYSIVEDPTLPRSIVLAPYFGAVWMEIPNFRQAGSWVYGWRHPYPDLRDRVIIVDDRPGGDDVVRKVFPDRKLFRLKKMVEQPYLKLVEVH